MIGESKRGCCQASFKHEAAVRTRRPYGNGEGPQLTSQAKKTHHHNLSFPKLTIVTMILLLSVLEPLLSSCLLLSLLLLIVPFIS